MSPSKNVFPPKNVFHPEKVLHLENKSPLKQVSPLKHAIPPKKYIDIDIESSKFWKKKFFFYIKNLFSIKTKVKTYAKVFVEYKACILVGICHD